jgi:hypothetical protein
VWDVLDVYLDGANDPVEVPVLTVYVVDYRELCDKAKVTAYPAGLDLLAAYSALVDAEPTDLKVVKKWGREHKVMVERRDPAGPTRTATPAVS